MACKDLITALHQHNITIKWVKGHNNNTGNEYADYLANNGRKSNNKIDNNFIPKSFLRQQLNILNDKEIYNRWMTHPGLRQSKLMMSDCSTKTIKNLIKHSRKHLRLITAIASGHCNLNYHCHNEGYINSPLCRDCEESDETPFHLAFECPAFDRIRHTTFIPEDADTLTKSITLLKAFNRYNVVLYDYDPP